MKPTGNNIPAEYYLRAAGVAAVWIDADGHVGAQDVASIEADLDRIAQRAVDKTVDDVAKGSPATEFGR